MNRRTVTLLTLSISVASGSAYSESLDLPTIPSNASSFYYNIGGGSIVSKAPTFQNTYTSTANIDYGFGYSCGKFDSVSDVDAIIDDLVNSVTSAARALPQHLMQSVTAAISAMPGYLLNKANPALYNVLMKGYDDSFELVKLSYGSCKAMESQVTAGNNPFQSLVTASIAESWQVQAGVNSISATPMTIDQIDEQIKETGADEGLALFADTKYGGVGQDPIRINYLTALVGYNVLLGNANVLQTDYAPSAQETVGTDTVTVMIPSVWPTSASAAEWIIDVIGDTTIRLHEGADNTAKPGKGLKTRVLQESFEIRKALEKAVDSNDFDDIREAKYANMLQLSGNMIDAIRMADPFDRLVAIDRVSTELAVKLMLDTVVLAKTILMAGLNESHLVISGAYEEFDSHIRTKSVPDLDAAVDDILKDLKLRENTFAKTPQMIVEEAELTAIKKLQQPGTPGVAKFSADPDGIVRQ